MTSLVLHEVIELVEIIFISLTVLAGWRAYLASAERVEKMKRQERKPE